MTKRRCTLRAEPKGNRKQGRCLRWTRPAVHKWTDARKKFVLGEFAGKRRRRVKRKK
jgi:hypothetical protein